MSNSYHSSFAKIRIANNYPTDGVIPVAFDLSGGYWAAVPGLIDITITGMGYTQINDTEQESPGGYKQYYAGRGEPISAAIKLSYSALKLSILTRFLPEPFGKLPTEGGRDYRPSFGSPYGNRLFEFELSPDLRLRTFGYLTIGSFGGGEDDRRTIDATVQGSGQPILVTGATSQTPGGVAA